MRSRHFLDEILVGRSGKCLVNNVTEELVLVLSTVAWPAVPDPSGERSSARGDSRRRGTPAHGEGSLSPHDAWRNAFTALCQFYPRLKRFRIIFTDIRVFVIWDQVGSIRSTLLKTASNTIEFLPAADGLLERPRLELGTSGRLSTGASRCCKRNAP